LRSVTITWLRWMPAVVVPAVIAAGVLIPLQAGAVTDLPDKTADEVLALVNDSSVTAFSGKLEQSSALGLPDLSAMPGAPAGTMPGPGLDDDLADGTAETTDAADATEATALASSALQLLTGSYTSRVYVDGPDNARLQIQDRLAERNFVRSGDDLWYYDSATNEATHATIPAGSADQARADAEAKKAEMPGDVPTPAELADRFLTEIDDSTAVSVGTDTEVAGRATYELLLTPRADGTLVQSVSIYVDAETGFPLGVTVLAEGQEDTAFQVAFTEVSFDAPDASLFAFTPPADATVTEQTLPGYDELKQRALDQAAAEGLSPESLPETEMTKQDVIDDLPFTLIGEGWGAIAELPAGSVPVELTQNPMFAQITSAVDNGQVFSTTLANVLVTDDGRVFAGSVPVSALQAAAAAAPAAE
ncbi:MAG: hypothetical protein R6W83_10615, partial [Cryobacterium sp.]